ncbi:hypothetical protein HBI18_170620 [Parastagonospora nodorum]|nr:hypothetical protein HBI18_170620 [Parastagonospora nodorum]
MCFGPHSLPASLFSKNASAQYHGADTPDEPDSGLELDLRGRKHVNQQDNADALYWMQDDTGSAFIAFADPGEASANAFRTFIQGRLPHDLVRDEYGRITPIAQVSHDHLPTLQAQLWLHKYAGEAHTPMLVDKCGPIIQHMSHDPPQLSDSNAMTEKMLLVASHFTFIVGLLQSKYIFVHRKKSNSTCELPGCQKQSGTQPVVPTIVNLEPLIHWATVTLAADISLCRGRVQAFRRDGEKCGDPLWTQAIRKFMPENAPSYCLDCLEMLMDNRVPIMASLDRRSVSNSFTAINAQPAYLTEAEFLRDSIGGSEKHVEHGDYRTVARVYELPASRNSPDVQTRAAPLNLDGACDVRPDEDSHNVVGSDCWVTSCDKASARLSDSNGPESDSASSATDTTPLYVRYSTPQSLPGAVPQDDIRSSRWATINNSPSSPNSPLSNRIYSNPSFGLDGTLNDRAETTLSKKNMVNTPSEASTRAFGREIDPNAVLNPLKMSTSMSKDAKMTKEKTKDIRDFLSPTLETPHRQEEAPNPTPPPVNPPENKPDSMDTFDAYLAHAAKNNPSPPPTLQSKSKSPPKTKKKSPLRTKPAPPTTTNGPFPAKLSPPPCPPTISPITYHGNHLHLPPPRTHQQHSAVLEPRMCVCVVPLRVPGQVREAEREAWAAGVSGLSE